jgi:hypothetical protein
MAYSKPWTQKHGQNYVLLAIINRGQCQIVKERCIMLALRVHVSLFFLHWLTQYNRAIYLY